MDLFLEKIVSSAAEITLFSALPFVWWAATSRKRESFFHWIGLRKASGKGKSIALFAILTLLGFITLSFVMLKYINEAATAASEFYGLDFKALPAVFVYAVLNTSLPEEMLFRGFLLKRLSEKLGFGWGNGLQSLVFGMIHGALFINYAGPKMTVIVVLFTGGVAWCMGYINEKMAGGSIIPSWCIHAAANVFSGLCYAFMLV